MLELCRPGVPHQACVRPGAAVCRPAGRRRSSPRLPRHKKCQKYCSLIRKRCVDTNRFGLVCPTLHVPAQTVTLMAWPRKLDSFTSFHFDHRHSWTGGSGCPDLIIASEATTTATATASETGKKNVLLVFQCFSVSTPLLVSQLFCV